LTSSVDHTHTVVLVFKTVHSEDGSSDICTLKTQIILYSLQHRLDSTLSDRLLNLCPLFSDYSIVWT